MSKFDTKESLENKLRYMGAVLDPNVKDCWWLNGHCIRVIPSSKGDGWELEEL